MRASRPLATLARRLRADLTDAERVLWREIRAQRFQAHKFRRQEPFGSYVVDFVCHRTKLIVELDGGHPMSQPGQDANRTRWLESQGYRVIRFWKNDVLLNLASLLEELEKALNAPSPPVGEGWGEGES